MALAPVQYVTWLATPLPVTPPLGTVQLSTPVPAASVSTEPAAPSAAGSVSVCGVVMAAAWMVAVPLVAPWNTAVPVCTLVHGCELVPRSRLPGVGLVTSTFGRPATLRTRSMWVPMPPMSSAHTSRSWSAPLFALASTSTVKASPPVWTPRSRW